MSINALSGPDKVTFSGETQDALYSLHVDGYFENDILKLDLKYTAKATNLIGKTYEIPLSADALNLDYLYIKPATVEWNGKLFPTKQFVRESLQQVFNGFVEKMQTDAARITFQEDGSMDLSFRDSQSKTFIPLSGHYAYRFHTPNFGLFEVGLEEAVLFSKAIFSYSTDLPNGLFWFVCRNNAFIPVYYRTYGKDNLLMSLALEDFSTLGRFLAEWTSNVLDDSDETRRLDMINYMLSAGDIDGTILLALTPF